MSTHTARLPAAPSAGIHLATAAIGVTLDFILAARVDSPTGFGVPPAAMVAALAITVPCAIIQRYAFRDSWTLAAAKALTVACFAALPTVLFSVMTAAWSVLGSLELASSRTVRDASQPVHSLVTEEN